MPSSTGHAGSRLSIALILPEILGTYGDNGNATILAQRARWRGIDAEIIPVPLGDPVPATCDIYTLGGGEDTAQILGVKHLREDGTLAQVTAPIFAICAGFQILGTTFHAGGRTVEGLGLIDCETTSLNKKRAIGELQSISPLLTGPATGFENHMGATHLGPDAQPFGRVTRGVGNTDAHDVEGAIQNNVIATYMHGPALARNPELADLLLQRATGLELQPLKLDEVDQLRRERLA